MKGGEARGSGAKTREMDTTKVKASEVRLLPTSLRPAFAGADASGEKVPRPKVGVRRGEAHGGSTGAKGLQARPASAAPPTSPQTSTPSGHALPRPGRARARPPASLTEPKVQAVREAPAGLGRV